jgi:hypothetical protein
MLKHFVINKNEFVELGPQKVRLPLEALPDGHEQRKLA